MHDIAMNEEGIYPDKTIVHIKSYISLCSKHLLLLTFHQHLSTTSRHSPLDLSQLLNLKVLPNSNEPKARHQHHRRRNS